MVANETRRKLDGLQVLRALAASAVVFEHVAFHARLGRMPVECPRWFELGHLGVDLFFVLSGFIIVHVHGDDIGRPERARDYAWRRFARVWPLLAILTTFKLLAGLVVPGLVPEDRYQPGVVATSYLCLPHAESLGAAPSCPPALASALILPRAACCPLLCVLRSPPRASTPPPRSGWARC